VLSIQTERERHEDAFVAWDNGLRLDEAALQTVYGGQKANWLKEGRTIDYEHVVSLWREGGPKEARRYLVENFKGLSWTKASFALAMLGANELMCIDSNVKNVLGGEIDLPDRIRSEATYEKVSEKVYDAVSVDADPFIVQWCLYDVGRGEHVTHMPFYRAVLYRQ
jgi:thermostable 8-oxoguanine DNA glycosylase